MKTYLVLLTVLIIPFIGHAEPTKVAFMDLSVLPSERVVLLDSIDKVLQHGKFALGPEVTELESLVAKYCQKKYAIGVSSGTDALFLALKSLNIGPGDEVITTSHSWIATAGAISMTGATPVFADILDNQNIDPQSVKALITSRTKAILPVHYTGKICEMDALKKLAKEHDLYLVEDCAQAFGATYHGKPSGYFGDLGCFSMNSWKIYGGCGEAGLIVTDDEGIYQKLLALRNNGIINKETCIEVSLNFKMDTIQAAILLERLKTLPEKIVKRRAIASYYNQHLAFLVKTPQENENQKDIYYTYQIQTPQRNALKAFLETRGIEAKIQHPILMNQQPVYLHSQHQTTNAEKVVSEMLSLPLHEKLTDDQVKYVVECIVEFFKIKNY